MIKIGIFVEGQTERIFVVKFLSEYLGGEHNFSRTEIINLGSKGTKIITERNFPYTDFYFLIFDTTGDGNVVPAILERADNMIKNRGFRYILALEDLYDRPRNKKKYVLNQFNCLTAKFPFQDRLKLILAIMEIEAWFLADYNLFSRLNSIATPKFINKKLNINLINKNPESFNHPAEVINKIYKLCGLKYKKREQQTCKNRQKSAWDVAAILRSEPIRNMIVKHLFQRRQRRRNRRFPGSVKRSCHI